VGYRGGREVARAVVETTGAPVALRLTHDRAAMAADGEDAQPFTVDAIDTRGRHGPTANLAVEFAISGGTIIGLGNGDPNSHEPEKGNRRSLFNGLAQVIVRVDERAGPVVLSATAAGLRAARASVRKVAAPQRLQVDAAKPVQIVTGWRQSPPSPTPVDPNATFADNDMNSWVWVGPGDLQSSQNGRWSLLRATFTPRRAVRDHGGTLVLTSVTGAAEVWLDGKKVGGKTGAAPGRIEVPIPPGEGPHKVSVSLDSPSGATSGLSGIAFVEERR